MIKSAAQKILMDASAVTQIVGAGDDARIHYIKLPQKSALPAVTLKQISGPRDNTLAGYVGTGQARLQVDCWGKHAGDVAALVEAVINALAGFSGAARGIGFDDVSVSNSTDFHENGPKIYRTSIDFTILWRTLPS